MLEQKEVCKEDLNDKNISNFLSSIWYTTNSVSQVKQARGQIIQNCDFLCEKADFFPLGNTLKPLLMTGFLKQAMTGFGLAPFNNPVYEHQYPLTKLAFEDIKRQPEWVIYAASKANIFSVEQIAEIKRCAQFGNRANVLELVRSVLFIMLVDMDMRGADIHEIRSCNVKFFEAALNAPRYALLHIPTSNSDPTGAFLELKENRAVCFCPTQFGDDPCTIKDCSYGILHSYHSMVPSNDSRVLNFVRSMDAKKTRFIIGTSAVHGAFLSTSNAKTRSL